jgi:hypothetical protein
MVPERRIPAPVRNDNPALLVAGRVAVKTAKKTARKQAKLLKKQQKAARKQAKKAKKVKKAGQAVRATNTSSMSKAEAMEIVLREKALNSVSTGSESQDRKEERKRQKIQRQMVKIQKKIDKYDAKTEQLMAEANSETVANRSLRARSPGYRRDWH